MKPKLLPGLALVLGICLVPLVAQAYWAVVPIHPKDINSIVPFVRVVTIPLGTNDSRMFFSVFVLPKDKEDERYFTGALMVKDSAGNFIAQSQVQPKIKPEFVPDAVPKSWAGKCLVFEFTVATNYLSQSEFDLNETGDLKWGTAGASFQCNLKEFSTAK